MQCGQASRSARLPVYAIQELMQQFSVSNRVIFYNTSSIEEKHPGHILLPCGNNCTPSARFPRWSTTSNQRSRIPLQRSTWAKTRLKVGFETPPLSKTQLTGTRRRTHQIWLGRRCLVSSLRRSQSSGSHKLAGSTPIICPLRTSISVCKRARTGILCQSSSSMTVLN